MKRRPPIPKSIADQLLVESRHTCNVCKRTVASIHHIKKINSAKGNAPSNLVVLCPECHRRAELQNSHFERKITSSQLRKYKNDWTEFCKAFPAVAFEKPVIAYCYLNEPRINMIFNQIANPADNAKVTGLKRDVTEASTPSFFKRMPLERMMQTIINNLNFINLETMDWKKACTI